ncbi:hypothetical protein [Vibrio harveyi]|uniref:hypothetical protein n=1 Tax=Vibrio harveyi TaxID=669 RepID=UPI000841DA28|nr:hypothetical protein [Vibrio harveyi]ODM57039.1 hypothetical protein BC455_18275 [Vibrio harveyi]
MSKNIFPKYIRDRISAQGLEYRELRVPLAEGLVDIQIPRKIVPNGAEGWKVTIGEGKGKKVVKAHPDQYGSLEKTLIYLAYRLAKGHEREYKQFCSRKRSRAVFMPPVRANRKDNKTIFEMVLWKERGNQRTKEQLHEQHKPASLFGRFVAAIRGEKTVSPPRISDLVISVQLENSAKQSDIDELEAYLTGLWAWRNEMLNRLGYAEARKLPVPDRKTCAKYINNETPHYYVHREAFFRPINTDG